MTYRAIKCWFCGQVPHPLDSNHAAWCSRIWLDRRNEKTNTGSDSHE